MQPIPKLLYTFWTGEMGPVVRHCLERLKQHYRGYEIKVLSDSDLPLEMNTLTPQNKAEYARLDALAKTGGVWMDASCLVFDKEWIQNASTFPSETEVVGFGAPFDGTVLENWALAAPHPSTFLSAWREEYVLALKEGPKAYCDRVKDQLPASLHAFLPSLTSHAAAAVVRRRHNPAAVHLHNSTTNGPFGVQSLLDWDVGSSSMYFLTQPVGALQAACGSFCKLRADEQQKVELILKRIPSVVRPGSVLHAPMCHTHHNAWWLFGVIVLVLLVAWWLKSSSQCID